MYIMKRNYQQMNSKVQHEPKKVVLLGDGCIGKSTLFEKLNKLNDENYRFSKKYKATDNFDFNRINITTSEGIVVIDLWDTAGQENRGGKLRDAYLKGADAVLLLYDVTERKTKDNILDWIAQIKNVAPGVPVAVLGNKSDKFKDLQQSESVKLRDCTLQSAYGNKDIRNFLISIKNDTHLDFISSFWSSTINIEEKQGCLVGLEFIMDCMLDTNSELKIET
jgi:small GTP-binding protein